ncbi:MAG: MATE family efflux transporter [Anaerovoracaceae bacterium]|jgi:putative MATE family efflux protein
MTQETLNNKEIYRSLMRVAIPIALQSLIGSSLNLVDNLMVGSLGESQLAAVGVSVQIYFVFWMVIYGFCGGCSTFMAQFWGAKDLVNIRKTIGFTLTVCMTVGLLFFLAAILAPEKILGIFTNVPQTIQAGIPYVRTGAPCFLFLSVSLPFEVALRATQQTRIPLYIGFVTFFTNTVLNYVFIFGNFGAPELGVQGAALATSIARGIQMTLVLFVILGLKNKISGKINCFFGWKKTFVFRVVRNSIPTTINETMWGLGMALYVAAFARMGETDYAPVQAANAIQNLLQMAAFSVGDAILILVGQKLGEGKVEAAVALAKKLLKIGILIGVICGVILMIIAKPIIGLFQFSPQGAQYTFYLLIIHGIFMSLVLYNGIMVVGVLRCGGDTRFAMLAEVGTVWLIGVPMAFLGALYFQWPIYLAVLGVKLEEVIKCFILTKRFLSKKWAKTVIRNL